MRGNELARVFAQSCFAFQFLLGFQSRVLPTAPFPRVSAEQEVPGTGRGLPGPQGFRAHQRLRGQLEPDQAGLAPVQGF